MYGAMKLSASITATLVPAMTLTGTLPNATAGAAYTGTLTLGGTFTAPVAIDASAGSIPSWMTPTVSGNTVTFTGTAPASAETDTFTVRATDSSATPQVATAPQSVVVSAASIGPTIVQQAVNQQSTATAATLTLGAAPTAGNLLVALVMSASYSPQTPTGGWTLVASSGGTSAAGYWVGLLTHTAASGDGTTVTPVTSAVRSGLAVWEVSSATAVELGAGGKLTSGTGSLAAVGAAAPSAASVPLSATMVNGVSPNSVFGWPAGWTGIGPLTVTGFPNYGVGAGYAAVTSGAVTGPTLTWTGTRGNGVVCVGGMAYVR